jgi:hypothetical protein
LTRPSIRLCDSISALALGLLAWRLALQGMADLESDASSIVLGLPHAPLSFALAALAGWATLAMLLLIRGTLAGRGAAS